MALQSVLPETRHAQSTPTKSFVGLSNAGFFKVDPRTGGIVDSQIFQYKTASYTGFKVAASTDDGDLVVGSKFGRVSLFDAASIKVLTFHSFLSNFAPSSAFS